MHSSVTTRTQVAGWKISSDDDRLELIRAQVFESTKDPLVLWVARSITAQCGRDEDCELEAIYAAVKRGPIPLPQEDGLLSLSTPGVTGYF